jgi:hypothetical protein
MPGLIFGFNINVVLLLLGHFCGEIGDEKKGYFVVILSYIKRNCSKLGRYAIDMAIHFL